jgi:hypothetical protein
MIVILGAQIGWFAVVALIALTVLGVIQMLKGFFPKEANPKIWAGIAAALYFALSAGIVFLPTKLVEWLMVSMLVLAIGQLGYEALWQTVIAWFKSFLNPPKA